MCKVSFDQCAEDPDGPSQIEGSVFYDLMWFSGNPDFGAWTASKSMMTEIFTNGPVVTVISLTYDEYELFNQESYLKNKRVLVPETANSSLPPSPIFRHCLMVYGWGQDEITGLNYWLVQNSWGESWADGGTARILRGMNWLETEWRGVSTTPRPCIRGEKCLNMSSIQKNNSGGAADKKNILQFENIKQMNYEFYTTTSSTILGGMSNIEVFSITMAVAVAISFLIYLLPGSSSSLASAAPSSSKMYGSRNADGSGNSFLPRFSANSIPEIVYGSSPSFSRSIFYGPSPMEGVIGFPQWRR
jgi:hypothetical protein